MRFGLGGLNTFMLISLENKALLLSFGIVWFMIEMELMADHEGISLRTLSFIHRLWHDEDFDFLKKAFADKYECSYIR